MCDLPDVSVMVERRRMKFMNNTLDSEHFHYIYYKSNRWSWCILLLQQYY